MSEHELFIKKYATKEQYDAWFLGALFSRGKTDNNIEILRSVMKGYNVYINQQINKTNFTEQERNFELRKLSLLTDLFNNTCNCLSVDGIHGTENNFIYFLISYVNNLGNDYCSIKQ